MDSADTIYSDKGISDVLDSSQRLELQNDSPVQNMTTNECEIIYTAEDGEKTIDNKETEPEQTVHASPSKEQVGQNKKALDTKETVESKNGSGEKVSASADGASIAAIDLSDPEQVIHMLETVDLNDEDTEVLLQEAYNMNRKLKEMLRRQENPDAPEKKSSKGKSKSNGHVKTNGHEKIGHEKSSSNASSSSGSRVGSAFSVRKPLPPITGEKESSVYAIKLRRSTTNVPAADMSQHPAVPTVKRSKSSKSGAKPEMLAGTGKKTKSKTEPRAEWDGRFNYS